VGDIFLNIGFWRYSLHNRGGDRLSLDYANYLADMGHDVTLYVADMQTIFSVSSRLKIIRLPDSGRIAFLAQSASATLKHDAVIVDIIHLALPLSRHNRVIYYAQADDVEYYDNFLIRSLIDRLYRWYFNSGRPYISMSRHLSGILEKRYGIKAPHTVRTGIDHSLFYPEPDSELCASKEGRRALVFMARGDVYRKGFDIARKVFQQLGTKASDRLELWVCGDTLENTGEIKVRNFGRSSDAQLRRILSSADLFLYPSRHEGFGLFPLEAMACGVVAVTTDAVPYARATPSMQVVDNGDHEGMVRIVVELLNNAQQFEYLKRQALVDAAGYDHSVGKSDFALFVADIVGDAVR
jgi:glycosyltransferase involved in cell wall biosynthesis